MPSNHISNTDYHAALDYEAVRMQKVKLQHRCSCHRKSLEMALDWLKENGKAAPDTKLEDLSEESFWRLL